MFFLNAFDVKQLKDYNGRRVIQSIYTEDYAEQIVYINMQQESINKTDIIIMFKEECPKKISLSLNVYSMLSYGAMIVMAVLILYSQKAKIHITTYLKALPIFAMLVGVAISFNELYHLIFPWQKISMFSISPHYESDTPVYSLVHNAVKAPINIVIYVLGFSLVAYIMLLIAMGVNRLAKGKKEKVAA